MQITNRELRSVDVHGQVHLTASAEVLDVAISTMLRTTRDSPGSLTANLGLGLLVRTTGMDVDRLGWVSDLTIELVRRNQIALALVPGRQDLGGGGTA
jgi:hypothetical protein